uniref:Transmembrane protein n=1 Tax=Marseillevirus LCMAC202 TaxID=2506606 RepID=A0A481YXR2_9VIRU|nr:MAG: hypothetical protein LCMAC202_02600 [Marseillevirus LCMAC202]
MRAAIGYAIAVSSINMYNTYTLDINKQRKNTLMLRSCGKGLLYGALFPVFIPLTFYRLYQGEDEDLKSWLPCKIKSK